jgi:hypothetical protein
MEPGMTDLHSMPVARTGEGGDGRRGERRGPDAQWQRKEKEGCLPGSG